MNIPQVKIVNCETGEEIVRDMNDEELAQLALDRKEILAQKKALAAKAEAKEALLQKLGISEEEARLLLG